MLPAGDVGVGGGGDDDEHEVDEEVREARSCFLSMVFSGSDSGARVVGRAATGVVLGIGRASTGAGRAGRGAWRTLVCRGGGSTRRAARLEQLRPCLEQPRPRLERLRSRPERGKGLRSFRSGEGRRLSGGARERCRFAWIGDGERPDERMGDRTLRVSGRGVPCSGFCCCCCCCGC